MSPPRTRYAPLLAALLLAVYFVMAVGSAARLGVTADEPIHLTGGYSYWTRNDYRLQPENGNFPQRWAALPLLFMQVDDRPENHEAWRQTDLWGSAEQFMYRDGNRPYVMLFSGRLMVALLGVAAGWLVFQVAANLFGPAGGLLATATFAFSPSMLAHGALATSDMAASLGFLGATLAGWRLLHRINTGRIITFGLALGFLALAKFSAPLFAISWAGVLALRLYRGRALPVKLGGWHARLAGWPPQLRALAAAHLAAALIAIACVWAAYGFRYRATPEAGPTPFNVPWSIVLGEEPFVMQTPTPQGVAATGAVPVRPDAVRALVRWTRDHRLLPEAYLYGFAHVYTYSHWRPAYFAGEYRTTGWWNFFPTLYLLKTPLPLLGLSLLMFATLAMLARRVARAPRAARMLYQLSPYLLFAGLYLATAVAGNLNIGHRHLLPVELFGCVLAGLLAVGWTRQPFWRRGVLAGLVTGAAVTAWQARSDYLAYFNPLAGGPTQAYRLFADSAVDWGQGLPALRNWLAAHPGPDPVYLAYFGWDNPQARGLTVRRIGDEYFDRSRRAFQVSLTPGIYVISATLLHGVYTMTPEPWTQADERRYRQLLEQVLASPRGTPPDDAWLEWDQLRFGRLCRYLRRRQPDAQPDPSLLIYRLSAEDLRHALLDAS